MFKDLIMMMTYLDNIHIEQLLKHTEYLRTRIGPANLATQVKAKLILTTNFMTM